MGRDNAWELAKARKQAASPEKSKSKWCYCFYVQGNAQMCRTEGSQV